MTPGVRVSRRPSSLSASPLSPHDATSRRSSRDRIQRAEVRFHGGRRRLVRGPLKPASTPTSACAEAHPSRRCPRSPTLLESPSNHRHRERGPIVTLVTNPHSLDNNCPVGVSPCLAEGALSVELDRQPALVAPGEVSLGPGVAISAVNLPGACRSFGFEK